MTDTQASENVDFWDCLNLWLRVIRNMVRQGRAPIGMSDEDYTRLHRDLLTHFDAPSENDLMPSDQLRQSLHRTVRPWVHLDSLVRCDKRILRMLEREVRIARSQLMPRQELRAQARTRTAAVLIVLVVAAISIGIASSGERRALAGSSLLEVWQYFEAIRAQLWLGVTQSSTNQRLIVLAGSMVLVGMFFLRTNKRY